MVRRIVDLVRAAHDDRRTADAGHDALEQAQRVGDHARVEDVIGRRRLAVEDGVRVALRVLALLHGNGDAVLVAEAVEVLVAGRDLGVLVVRAGARAVRAHVLRAVAVRRGLRAAAEAAPLAGADDHEDVVGEAGGYRRRRHREARRSGAAHLVDAVRPAQLQPQVLGELDVVGVRDVGDQAVDLVLRQSRVLDAVLGQLGGQSDRRAARLAPFGLDLGEAGDRGGAAD